jgi:glycosyltransferase involved in cell wall biosynthesis
MRIVFWQNCLSPHQLPYITHLQDDPRVDSVVVAAGEAVSAGRAKMGWNVGDYPGLDRCEVYLSPMPQTIDYLLSLRQEDTWHLFTGISAFPFVFSAFKRSLAYSLRRGLIMELPNTFAYGRRNAKPLWLHHFRYMLGDRKYAACFHKVFAIGQRAVDYYRGLCSSWQVYSFVYCVGGSHDRLATLPTGGAKFVFVGSLDSRKSPITILDAVSRIVVKSFGQGVTLIGEGMARGRLENYIAKENLKGVDLMGTISNTEIPHILSQNDILILSSLHDGWGAVVNEALNSGCYVLCSDQCGAKELLTDPSRGRVFQAGNAHQLAELMETCCQEIDSIRRGRAARLQWARRSISGKVVARYMVDCLADASVKQPWR